MIRLLSVPKGWWLWGPRGQELDGVPLWSRRGFPGQRRVAAPPFLGEPRIPSSPLGSPIPAWNKCRASDVSGALTGLDVGVKEGAVLQRPRVPAVDGVPLLWKVDFVPLFHHGLGVPGRALEGGERAALLVSSRWQHIDRLKARAGKEPPEPASQGAGGSPLPWQSGAFGTRHRPQRDRNTAHRMLCAAPSQMLPAPTLQDLAKRNRDLQTIIAWNWRTGNRPLSCDPGHF